MASVKKYKHCSVNQMTVNKLACRAPATHNTYGVRLFLFLVILLIATPLIAAENLLIVDVYVRILPEDQIEPISDPVLEAILGPARSSQSVHYRIEL
jgi:hypothetical protein